MKKQVKILALGVAVAVALVGAGYAAWGTTITDTTKMQTGEWKIVLENDSDSSYWAGDSIGTFSRVGNGNVGAVSNTTYGTVDRSYDALPAEPDGAVNPNAADYVYVMEPQPTITGGIPGAANQNATACTFQFFNLHPGTKAYTRFEIRNDGSIPAQIGNVTVKILDGNGASIAQLPANDPIIQVVNEMRVNPVFGIHTGTGAQTDINIAPCTLLELEGKLQAALVGKVLVPDYKLYSYDANINGSDELDTGSDTELANSFNFELPGSALEGNTGMLATFQVVIVFDFVQYNQNPPVAATGSPLYPNY